MRPCALLLVPLLFGCSSDRGARPNPPSAPASSQPAAAASSSPPPLLPAPVRRPLSPFEEARIDAVVRECIDRGEIPGAVVVVLRDAEVVLRKAYGLRAKLPARSPMTPETLFDLASLTKPIATASAILLLAERKKLRLGDPVSRYLADFAQNGKERITIEQLLLHTSGLPADNSLRDYDGGRDAALGRIHRLAPAHPPGSNVVYSDLGYIVLGEIVEHISGERLDAFVRKELFEPLGLRSTTFLPGPTLAALAAPTEQRDGHFLQGTVHDPRAHLLGGVAGHAGLFSTADDLAIFARMLLLGGQHEGRRILSTGTVSAMLTPRPGPTDSGKPSAPPARSIGLAVTFGGVGHTGFTGTSIWLDPARRTAVILLASRVHPDGKGDATRLRREVVRIVAEADKALPAAAPVMTGIDVLARDDFRLLSGRRIGLVTNQTGRSKAGERTIDLLHRASGATLVAIFSPEHGIRGQLSGNTQDEVDEKTRLPIYSLYGKDKRPTDRMLQGIDTLVYDIQDVGCRFYTYITTLGYVLEEAARRKLRVIVLDRPNPLGGIAVEGPLLDAGRESFVGYHAIPVRYGMTAGELGELFNRERRIGADLTVVRMQGWRRSDRFEQTGLGWVDPSPNIKNPTAALLYPGIGLLETTQVSVGRGTPHPFERIGAPWIDAALLAAELQKAALAGVRFTPIRFRPAESTHRGKDCGGVSIEVTDADRLEPVRMGIEIARQLRKLYPSQWDSNAYQVLLGSRSTWEALERGEPTDRIVAAYQPALVAFIEKRKAYLLY